MALLCVLVLLAASGAQACWFSPTRNSIQSTHDVLYGRKPSTDEVTNGSEPSTDEVTNGSEPSTDEVTNGSEPSTDNVPSGTEPSTDVVTNDTELVFALMTHRNGHKPPNEFAFPFMAKSDIQGAMSLNPRNSKDLTNVGKRTGFKLGEFIRRRYGRLLSPMFDPSEIYIRTTDYSKSAMTLLTAMAAVYPANHTWSDSINWEPIPYTTVPKKYDFNDAYRNCPTLKNAILNNMMASNSRMDPFAELSANITNVIKSEDVNFTRAPVTVYFVRKAYTCLISSEYKVNDEILALMPGIKAASDVATDIIFGDDRYLNLEAGPLLNEFFTYAREIIAGEDTPRVRVYSGHDINVFALTAISKAKPRQGFPKYGSLFSLELRKVIKTGEYVVVPVYLSEPGVKEIYLTVEGCDQLCDFDTFYNITSSYLLDEDAWRTSCGLCTCDCGTTEKK